MKIGIMGGTFDPIHNGHLMLAREALCQFRLDQIWFMPNGNPPHKSKQSIQSDIIRRTDMTRLAIRESSRFRLQLYETNRKEISYTYKTLEHFSERYREHSFYFIVGADSLFAIENWFHPERIFRKCTVLAACRDDIDTHEKMQKQILLLKEKYHADIHILDAPLMNVSSHELRTMIQEGKSISEYVPEAVENYIREENLYGAKPTKTEL